MRFDREKFKSLVHYIIWKAGCHDGFEAVKLNKILWFSDARAYVSRGEPMTGATYIREGCGPVPRQFISVRDELIRQGLIRMWTRTCFNEEITRFQASTAPEKGVLTDDERQIVDYWIKHVADEHAAGAMSEESHDYGWKIAEPGEELPLYAILANRLREPNDDELADARRRARERESL